MPGRKPIRIKKVPVKICDNQILAGTFNSARKRRRSTITKTGGNYLDGRFKERKFVSK